MKSQNKQSSKKPSSKSLALFDVKKTALSISKLREKNLSEVADIAEKVVVGHAKKHISKRLANLQEIRRSVMIWLAIMGVLITSLLLFRSMGRGSYKNRDFTSGGIYTEGVLSEVSTLNPIFASSEAEKIFSEIAFLKLFDLDTSGKMNYEVAKSVATSDNYKNFSLKMRDNIVWSDGRKLTADDVIFTTEVLKSKTFFPQRSQSWKNVEIAKKGDFELEIKTPAGTPLVLHSFSFPILPKHKFEGLSIEQIRSSDFEKSPVTSGAFSYKSTQNTDKKTIIRLEKNDRFYQGVSKLDNFEIAVFAQKDDLKKSLLNGEISASADLEKSDFSEKEIAQLDVNSSQISRGIFAFLNTGSEVLKDKNIRQAISLGVDMAAIRKSMSAVFALNGPIFEEFYNPLEAPQIDRAAAEKKLDDAGWKLDGKIRKKDGKNLTVSISATSENNLQKSAENLAKQLQSLGFEVKLTIADKNDKTGTYVQSVVQARGFDILLFEIDLGADADIYPFWHSSQATLEGLNFSNYKDRVADDFLVNYRNETSSEAKKIQMTKFAQRWRQEVPALPVARVKSEYFYRNGVKTYDQKNSLVSEINRYTDVIYWQVNKSALYKTQ